jgi:hypothetical protein
MTVRDQARRKQGHSAAFLAYPAMGGHISPLNKHSRRPHSAPAVEVALAAGSRGVNLSTPVAGMGATYMRHPEATDLAYTTKPAY